MSRFFLAVALAALVLFGCKQTSKPANPDALAINADTTINPSDDFFDFANGAWIKKNNIPADQSSWGIGQLVFEELYIRTRNINEEAIKKNDDVIAQKIANFWVSGMDTVAIEKQGIQPIQSYIDAINNIKNINGLQSVITDMHIKGMSPLFVSFVSNDAKNSDAMRLHLWQGGLGLPNRDYYFNTDERTTKIRAAYKLHLQKMFVLMGDDTVAAAKNAATVYKLENSLATSSRKLEALREPYANYNKMAVTQLSNLSSTFKWSEYFTSIGAAKVDSAIVGQPEFFKTVETALKSFSIEEWKSYLRWNLVNFAAPYLSEKFVVQDFDFYRKQLRGIEKQKPRWKEVLDNQKNLMGELVGQLFVKEYFNDKAKQRYNNMVEDIRTALKNRIEQLTWMSDSTKQKALAKLAGMKKKVGYPGKWKDFSAMKIEKTAYINNIITAHVWWHNYNITKLGKPANRDEWEMAPQEYNAYYNPNNNEIVLPAGIFTVPGYKDEELDDAVVYGYAGASTIGHEITHGFDDQGRQYDAAGNLKSWWSKEDETKFNQRAAVMVKQFNSYNPIDTLHINGSATLGENIADLGGIILGWEAFKKSNQYKKNEPIAGYTPAQRYFMGYALGWLGHERKEALANQLLTDVHSPAKYRVNGPLSDVNAFYEVYKLTPASKMFIADSARVKIW
jgi:putative endopeptidase